MYQILVLRMYDIVASRVLSTVSGPLFTVNASVGPNRHHVSVKLILYNFYEWQDDIYAMIRDILMGDT